MTGPRAARVGNPMAAPALPLPTVHVHGGTSWRRRVLLGLAAAAPSVAIPVLGLVAPVDAAVAESLPSPFTGVMLIWGILAARALPPLARWTRHVGASLVGAAWAFAAVAATVDRDAASWSGIAVSIVVVATLVGVWLGWWLAGLRFGAVGPLVAPMPAMQSPTSRSAWSERMIRPAHVALLLGFTVVAIALIVASLPDVGVWIWAVPLALYGLLCALSFAIRTTADRRGLRVRSRILGIPLVTVPLDRIRSAVAAVVDETEWGQIGSTADRELTTIIHRSGPALIVTRTDGSMVVVSAERPDHAAAVLEALRTGASHERG